ncbi:hypothetical protein XH98_36380 [Bradyrhizobium sp. CCBAU 51745]|nr:hypothetical protein [Bradyrhizobium sp. CCBAU 51745]
MGNLGAATSTSFARPASTIPHLAYDTVGALAQLIQENYHLVAREVDAQEAAVISIGQLVAGSIHNVIPEKICAAGTLRTQSPSSRIFILQRLNEVAEASVDNSRSRSHWKPQDPFQPASALRMPLQMSGEPLEAALKVDMTPNIAEYESSAAEQRMPPPAAVLIEGVSKW